MGNLEFYRQIGEDRILRQGENLVVCSRVEMEDWQLHGTRKTAILIDDGIWCFVGKEFMDNGEIHYILEPYSDYVSQIPGRRIRYDENYVKTRSETDMKREMEDKGDLYLYPLRSFIGFLPSRRKAAIEKKYGLPARNATFASIMMEFYLSVLLGFFWWVFVAVSDTLCILAYLSVIVLIIDIIFRYGSYFRDDSSPLGFMEWLVKFLKRKSRKKPLHGIDTRDEDLIFPYK